MIEGNAQPAGIDRAAQASRFFCGRSELAQPMPGGGATAGTAGAYRLVKGSKSPTDRFPGMTGAYFNRKTPGSKPLAVVLEQAAPDYAPDLRQAGTWAVVEKRPWAGEQRIRMETRPGATADMPTNEGERVTATLTDRGARKISESCFFMACQRGGFSTFATLTLTSEARAKLSRRVLLARHPMSSAGFAHVAIEPARAKQGPLGINYQADGETPAYNVAEQVPLPVEVRHSESGALFTPLKLAWQWSVQSEVSRFFEAANKMYTRGWQYQDSNEKTVKVPGSRKCIPKKRTATTDKAAVTWLLDGPYTPIRFAAEPLAYLWVSENPNMSEKCWLPEFSRPIADENGELLTNPHVHLMMKWAVPFKHFTAWAARLEMLWGHGFAHLEKIKDPQKAGSYVAKAAGYLCKAQGKGDNDQGEIRGNRYAISSRARAPAWIETERYQVGMMGWLLAEASEIWSQKHGPKIQEREKLKRNLEATRDPGARKKIGRLLEQVRAKIEPLARASKYGVIFKTDTQKNQFFEWAKRRGWTPEPQNSLWLEQWRFRQWRHRNRARLDATAGDLRAWFDMADSGAVACNDETGRWEQMAV